MAGPTYIDSNTMFENSTRELNKTIANFPFAAIIGQDEMKLALQLNMIDPKIGGVMIIGDRGTGKSTTIRALIDLLPTIPVIKGDPFNTDPANNLLSYFFRKYINQQNLEKPWRDDLDKVERIQIPMVELPLGATEDRVCGTVNLKEVLSGGKNTFEPGLLARANRGILYVDEVNLLDDHIIDILLDSAASGWNIIEREGISIKHPAQFVLIGSGNPEEGELRPQLLDRFGMHAKINTTEDPKLRLQIVKERMDFDSFPKQWLEKYHTHQSLIQKRVRSAQLSLKLVEIDSQFQLKISEICSGLKIEGLRGDIVCNRAAKAMTAFEGRTKVSVDDIRRTIFLCLRHRLRRDPMESISESSETKIANLFERFFGDFSSTFTGFNI